MLVKCMRTSSSVVGAGGVGADAPAGRAGAADALLLLGAAGVDLSAARNGVASGGADISRLARIVRGDTFAPYASLFVSSSGRSTPPERLMPANNPFAREYERISAVSAASVPTLPAAPTGPAATDASAPSVTLFVSNFCTPASFITSRTRSTCSARA